MSQQERLPQFNFPADDYLNTRQPSASNALPSQWGQRQGFGGSGNLGLRHSVSIDSMNQRRGTASTSRSEKSFNFAQANGIAQRIDGLSPLDPSLRNAGLLSVTARSNGRASMSDLYRAPNPITRYIEDVSPWNPEKVSRSSIPTPKDGRSLSSNLGPNLEFGSYRDHPGSELESTGTGIARDSGYGTLSQPATQSIASMEPTEFNQEVPSEINFHISHLNFATGSSLPTMRTDRTDRIRPTKVKGHSYPKSLECTACGERAKCPSEFKKHQLKHAKPFKCTIRGCRRGPRGFTTVNDLNRHKKSVHNIIDGAATKSYQCASEVCRKKDKIWPRLDNFKQHIKRMHTDENVDDLVRRSLCSGERQRSDSPTPQPSLSVAPMDTTLAGTGTGFERNFSMTSYNAPGASAMTPDKTSQSWNTLDVSPPDFDIDDNSIPANQEFYASPSQHPGQGMTSVYRQTDIGQSIYMNSHTPIPWQKGSGSTSSGLSTLADVACNAPPQISSSSSSEDMPSQRPLVLSGEPQTKAEQQKRALGHISKVIAMNIPEGSQGKSLDQAVLRFLSTRLEKAEPARSVNELSSASDNDQVSSSDDLISDGPEETMTKTELVKGLQALASQIKRGKFKKVSVVGQRQRSYSGSEICQICKKTLRRRCDLKKHMKRHTRPYGCTFPKCKRTFGSKSDWKRHEDSQHFQLETWRCSQLKETSCCAELFYRREVFEEHLKDKHGMASEAIHHEAKACRIGRNGQGQFWCGFCVKVVELKSKRSAAWIERFNHIDDHFNKEMKKIDSWVCLEARKTKGEVLREMDKNYFDDDDDAGGDDIQDEDSPSVSQSMPSQYQTSSDGSESSPMILEGSPAESSNPRKRQGSSEPVSSSSSSKAPVARKDIVRYCCKCRLGPYASKIYGCCMDCGHEFCPACSRKAVAYDWMMENDVVDIFAHPR